MQVVLRWIVQDLQGEQNHCEWRIWGSELEEEGASTEDWKPFVLTLELILRSGDIRESCD